MKDKIVEAYQYDIRKFEESLSAGLTEDRLIANILILSHILEKSLSNEEFEPGHGFDYIKYLVDVLGIYNEKKYTKNRLCYREALSVLAQVRNSHKETDFIDKLDGILRNNNILGELRKCDLNVGGANKADSSNKADNHKKNFLELSSGRYSVRNFSDKPVKKADIEQAVKIALKTPSACNRQPVRVRVIFRKDAIERVLRIQKGMRGYPTPPCLILITSDDNSYFDPVERNQGFIDGGLFAMSLLYSLEYYKIGACALSCMLEEGREKSIRGMMGIPENEKIVLFIACGYFKEKYTVCKSPRYDVGDIMFEVKELSEFVLNKEPDYVASVLSEDLIRELEILRCPGIKLACRKLLGSIRRKMHKVFKSAKRSIKEVVGYTRDCVLKGKDGAILTICVFDNFGNVLQRYALQKFLRKNGLHFASLDMSNHKLNEDNPLTENISKFVRRYIQSDVFDVRSARRYKNYIVGSDQIWRPELLGNQKGGIGSFFLDFLKESKAKRISYAGSFGHQNLNRKHFDKKLISQIKPLIRKFDSISVRESSAKDIVDDLAGKAMESKLVLDPTLLLGAEDYEGIIEDSCLDSAETNDVFYFTFDDTPVYKNVIQNIQDVFGCASSGWSSDVGSWLRRIRNSKLVVSGSFHAVVFSIIFHVDFVVIEDSQRPNERVRSLINLLGIGSDRIISHDDRNFDVNGLRDIDWPKVDSTLNILRNDSGDWLIGAIRGDKQ